MEVRLGPELEARLRDAVRQSGQPAEEIVEDALSAWLEELDAVRKTLDTRYDDVESGKVKPIDGEDAFRRLTENKEPRRRLV